MPNLLIRFATRLPFLYGFTLGGFGLYYLEWYKERHCPLCHQRFKKYSKVCPRCRNEITWTCDCCGNEVDNKE